MPTPSRQRPRRLYIEQLEDRVTPAATVPAVLPGHVPDRVLVELADPGAAAGVTQSPLTTAVMSLGGNAYRIDLVPGTPVTAALSLYAAIPGVTVAEPDYYISAQLNPNDTLFGSLWGMNNTGQSGGVVDADIDAPEAWNNPAWRGTGDTVVGVIDSGIDYRHQDLYSNIWINEGEIPTAIRNLLVDTDSDTFITFRDLNNPVNQGAGKIQDWNNNGRIDGGDLLDNRSGWEFDGDNDRNGYVDDLIGWDFFSYDNDPSDATGHGTHVAGTIGASGNNVVGVTGVAWKTRMGALRFLGPSGGTTSGAINAIHYSRVTGMKVTNNSWGGGPSSTLLFNAINQYRVAGGLFVAAAGNSATNNDLIPHYPSNYDSDNVLAVAAMTRNDGLSSFSQYGIAMVDIGAPGSDILSTTPGESYDLADGTSMASPHVAGAAAVIWDAYPSLTYAEVKARILQTARPVAAMAGKVATGGMLNLEAALSVANPPPPPGDISGPRVVSSAFSGSTASSFNTVRLTFNETINAATFTVDDVVTLTGPNGAITPTGVTPVSGTVFDVTFADQTAPGGYSITVGPAITDPTGNPMNQDNDFINGEVPADQYTAFGNIAGGRSNFSSAPGRVAIRDLTTAVVPIVVPITQTIADLDVSFNITHTWDSDLVISLRAPNGTQVLLVNRRGGSGDNFTDTVLDDEAADSVAGGRAPFAGTYRPEGLLSTFDNLAANGTWQFLVYDGSRSDVGYIHSVTLSFLFNNSGSMLRFTASTNPRVPPVVALVGPAVRAGGDFAQPGVATDRPPLMTPKPGWRPDATEVQPAVTIAPPKETGVTVVVAQPRWVTEVYENDADEFSPIEV